MSNKHDPLEDAKVGEETKKKGSSLFGRKKKKKKGSSASEPAAEAVSDSGDSEAPAASAAAESAAPMPSAPLPPPTKTVRYKAKNTKTISWRGNVTTILAGAEIQPGGYGGEAGLDKLRACGLELELIED